MEPSHQDWTENVLLELSISGQGIRLVLERLAEERARQKRLVEQLLIHTDLPLAEISRVAQLHRQTVGLWKKELVVEIDQQNRPANGNE